MLIKTITYNDFSLLKDNFLLRFIKKYIIISSTYRNIGAFFIVARTMHAYKNLLVLLMLHVSFYTF